VLTPEMAGEKGQKKPFALRLASDELPRERKGSWLQAKCAGFR
jgi:hypothetical protein